MKRILLLALCALLSANADARTLYVDATRPNNNGNGLSAKKAKKTIQAAINAASAGDTIIVLPGAYAPIKTENKKIVVKSSKGKSKTSIVMPAKKAGTAMALAQLGVSKGSYVAQSDYVGTDGSVEVAGRTYTWDSSPWSTGTATSLVGFLLDGKFRGAENNESKAFFGVSGGVVKACTIQRIGAPSGHSFGFAARDAKLTGCRIQKNRYVGSATGVLDRCTANRCVVADNRGDSKGSYSDLASNSTLANTLLVRNKMSDGAFLSCVALNCTVADNTLVFSSYELPFSYASKHFNCILRNNRQQGPGSTKKIHNADTAKSDGNKYKNTNKTNKDPAFAADYTLRKGSFCIDAGALTDAQKTLVGTKDLAGNKRVKGKAVDIGCYEY